MFGPSLGHQTMLFILPLISEIQKSYCLDTQWPRAKLKIRFCQFARRSSLFFLLSAIAPKMKVHSRAKSD